MSEQELSLRYSHGYPYFYQEQLRDSVMRSHGHYDGHFPETIAVPATAAESILTGSAEVVLPPPNLEKLHQSAAKASQLLKALAHPDRLQLLCQLSQGEYCVGDLEQRVGITQPSLSQQLGILRQEELVTARRDGKRIYYRIASNEALAVLQTLFQLYCAE